MPDAALEVRTYGGDARPRVGFFTDTSLCIGCKACEVACKEWNDVPGEIEPWTGESYDNTRALGADTWRHVAFIEQKVPVGADGAARSLVHTAAAEDLADRAGLDTYQEGDGLRWLMASDVCKHCTDAACLDVCPTGALFRTEFGTVVVQQDVCNGCGYCVPACPFGVLDRRREDGRVWKCTLCYDRLRDDQEPACAQACPTNSIQFGELSDLRERAGARLETLAAAGQDEARLYLADDEDGVGGARRVLPAARRARGLRPAAGPGGDDARPGHGVGGGRRGGGRARRRARRGRARWAPPMSAAGATQPRAELRSYYGRPVLKAPVWTDEIPLYFFAGGLAGASCGLAYLAGRRGDDELARRAWINAAAAIGVSPLLLVADLGRPQRFLNMLRLFKVTSPMSVGSWILARPASPRRSRPPTP